MVDKRNIFLIGPMGAGKSTVGRQLAQQLNMDFFDSDQEIERRTGVDISWVFDVEGEEGFRCREAKIINELTSKYGIVLATGGGSVKLYETRKNLASRGFVIYLKVGIDKQLFRTQKDKRRPLLQKGGESLRQVLEDLASERNPLYMEISDMVVNTDMYSVKFITKKIIDML